MGDVARAMRAPTPAIDTQGSPSFAAPLPQLGHERLQEARNLGRL